MKSTLKRKDSKLFLLRVMSIVAGCAGLATLIPYPGASEMSILGYKALCPFAPISTVIALYLSVTIHGYRAKLKRQSVQILRIK